MAKQRKVDDGAGDSSDEEMAPTGLEVQVDFESQTPEADDYHGIKIVLGQAFPKVSLDLGGIADEIIKRSSVSQCLKQALDDAPDSDDEEDMEETPVFGVISTISLTEEKRAPAVDAFRAFLVSKCQDCAEPSAAAKFMDHMTKSKVGLLLNERSSLPPAIAAPVLEALMKDWEALKKKDPMYDFSHFVVVSKVHQLAVGAKEDAEWWVNPEEKYLAQSADCSFDFEIDPSDNDQPVRRVLLFPAQSLATAISKFKKDLPSLMQSYSGA
jgi:hypothetical protein